MFHLLFLLSVWFFDYVFARSPSGSLAGLPVLKLENRSVADTGKVPGPPLFVGQIKTWRAEKNFFGDCLPPPLPHLRVCMTEPSFINSHFFSGFGSFWESFLSGDIPGAQLLAVISKTIIVGEMRGVFIELLIRPFIREKISCGLLWPRLIK